jgi:hypothetical protein
MPAQRLVTTGVLTGYQAIVGDLVGLVVEAAADLDSVGFPRHQLTDLLHQHELIEPA